MLHRLLPSPPSLPLTTLVPAAQMKELAGDHGIIIVGFWNGNKFGEALQYFYHRHPELCGTMKGAKIDFEDRHLDTAEGYHTHWTTPEEARGVNV